MMRQTTQIRVVYYAILIGAVVFFLLPFVWAFSTSLKLPADIAVYPPRLLPAPVTFGNYLELWEFGGGIFKRFFINSVIVSVGTTLVVVGVSMLAGYGFAILDFHGKEVIFVLLLTALLIPFQALLVPLFALMRDLRLLNTYACLIIIYATFQLPFGIFMMRNAFSTVPKALRESAQMDGANELRVMWTVMLPLVLPGLVTLAIYCFYTSWNEFLVALVFTTREEMKTLTVGLQQLTVGRYGTRWETLTAGSIVSFIPVMILFIFLQRYFVRGLTGGALKG
jgi:multiple sugar transport system permease protein